MQFSTVRAVVGFAFQMSEVVPTKTATYGEQVSRCFSELSQNERHMLGTDVLAKVGRLPWQEQAVIAALFTGATKALNEAATILPAGWPVALRRELVRGWARDGGLERSQALIAETFMLSQQTVSRRWSEACRLLNSRLDLAMATLEVQLLDIIDNPSSRNAGRYHGGEGRLAA